MKNLQQIKDEVANEWFEREGAKGLPHPYTTLSNGVKVGNIKQRYLEECWDLIAKRYAEEAVREVEKADAELGIMSLGLVTVINRVLNQIKRN